MFSSTTAVLSLQRSTRRLLAVIILVLTLSTQYAAAQGSWVSVADEPTARYLLGAVTGLDGHIYAIGGSINVNEVLDVFANTWITASPMPVSVLRPAVVEDANGLIYTIGGYNPGFSVEDTVQCFDPETGIWSTLTAMPTARVQAAAVCGVDGLIYVIGGWNNVFLNTVETYDPKTGVWSSITHMPTARDVFTAVSTGDKIYVMGGETSSTSNSNIVEVYNITTGTWSTAPPMPTGRRGLASAIGPDNKIYTLGGFQGSSAGLSVVEAYDISTNIWNSAASLATGRGYLAASTGPDGRIYAIGGNTGSSDLNAVEAYTVQAALTPVSSITVNPITVAGGKTATGTIKIKTAAPTGGALVALASTNSAAHMPVTVVVPSGMTSVTFTITTDQVPSNVTGAIKATSGAITKSVNLTVRPVSVQSVTLVPSAITGGGISIGVVTLEERSTIGDTTVTLSSNNGSVAGPLVASITIPEGSSSGSFTIGSNPVSANTVVAIKAAVNGLTKSANLTVKSPAILSLTLTPSVVNGGDNVIGVVFLNSPAGPGGKTITVLSNDSAASPASSTFLIPEGSSVGSFNIATSTVVSIVHAKITASANGVSKVVALTINP